MNQAATRKKPVIQDWHPADVIAGLRKAGWSMQQLAFANGYTSHTALGTALRRPYPKAERIIAGVLEVQPGDIWPSRYLADKVTPNRGPSGAKPRRPDHIRLVQGTTAGVTGYIQTGAGK